jgi:hypothetical protein
MIDTVIEILDVIDAVPPMTLGQILVSLVPMTTIIILQAAALLAIGKGNRPSQ